MMLVIVGMRNEEHSFRSYMGIGSESDCLLGQLKRIFENSDSDAGLKVERSGGEAIMDKDSSDMPWWDVQP